MKSILLVATLLFAMSALAETKICRRTVSERDGRPSDLFIAHISERTLVITEVTGSEAWAGQYQRDSDAYVDGRDGHSYLDFNARGEEGCNSILVDERLLSPNTRGLIKFRCRGEGFNEAKYLCRDHQPN